MSKSIRNFLSFLLVLQLILPYSTFAAAVGEFSSVVGGVTQTRAREVMTPNVKSPVEMKDLIATARSASAMMVFSDDSTITLSENTKLEIKEFLFKDNSRRGIFSLAIGKLTANVKKYIGGDNVFEVNSPSAGVGVRGTGFEFVEGIKEGNVASNMATVACTDGSLNLSALSATGEVVSTATLEAGQVAVIIGGVITISAIGAAMAAAAIAKATETGAAGAAGGAGAGTGGAAAAGSGATVAAGGTAAAATGMSTAAIAGIAIGGVAVVGGVAAAAGSSGSSKSTPPPTDYSAYSGTWSGNMTCTGQSGGPCCQCGGGSNSVQVVVNSAGNATMTANNECRSVYSGAFSGNVLTLTTSNGQWHCNGVLYCNGTGTGTITFSDTNNGTGSFTERNTQLGCQISGNVTFSKQGSVTIRW